MKPLTIVCLLALAQPAFAQNAAPPPTNPNDSTTTPAPQPNRRNFVRFEDADTDHDGRLSRSEAQAMPFVSRHFDEVDTNHDGYISRDELRAFRLEKAELKAQRQQQQVPSGGSAPAQQPGSGNPSQTPDPNSHGPH